MVLLTGAVPNFLGTFKGYIFTPTSGIYPLSNDSGADSTFRTYGHVGGYVWTTSSLEEDRDLLTIWSFKEASVNPSLALFSIKVNRGANPDQISSWANKESQSFLIEMKKLTGDNETFIVHPEMNPFVGEWPSIGRVVRKIFTPSPSAAVPRLQPDYQLGTVAAVHVERFFAIDPCVSLSTLSESSDGRLALMYNSCEISLEYLTLEIGLKTLEYWERSAREDRLFSYLIFRLSDAATDEWMAECISEIIRFLDTTDSSDTSGERASQLGTDVIIARVKRAISVPRGKRKRPGKISPLLDRNAALSIPYEVKLLQSMWGGRDFSSVNADDLNILATKVEGRSCVLREFLCTISQWAVWINQELILIPPDEKLIGECYKQRREWMLSPLVILGRIASISQRHLGRLQPSTIRALLFFWGKEDALLNRGLWKITELNRCDSENISSIDPDRAPDEIHKFHKSIEKRMIQVNDDGKYAL